MARIGVSICIAKAELHWLESKSKVLWPDPVWKLIFCAGLRHRYTSTYTNVPEDEEKAFDGSPVYYSAKASVSGRHKAAGIQGGNGTVASLAAVQPINLQSRLAGEVATKPSMASATQHIRATPPQRARPHAQSLGSTTRASPRKVASTTPERSARVTHSPHHQPSRSGQMQSLKGKTHSNLKPQEKSRTVATRKPAITINQQQGANASPVVQKRKSSRITATPARTVSQSPKPQTPVRSELPGLLSSRSMEKKRAQARPRQAPIPRISTLCCSQLYISVIILWLLLLTAWSLRSRW